MDTSTKPFFFYFIPDYNNDNKEDKEDVLLELLEPKILDNKPFMDDELLEDEFVPAIFAKAWYTSLL